LTVAGAGATSTDNVDIQVTAPPIEPTANITCFNCAGEAPITVQFDGSGSTSPQSTIESYHWDLGGGVGANEAVVSHTFTNPGTYNVMLTVTDSLGLTGTETMPIVVASPPEEENQPPVASFTFSTLSGEDPLALMFDGSGASDTDGTIEAYNWDFGDGNSSSSMSVNHTFAEVGEYQVTLQVTDNDGESTVSMQTVNVQAEEEIDLFIEISEMQIDDNWTPVSFSKPFNDPVVIVGPPSFSDSDPATVRVRNVTADGFEIRIQKWDYLENGHGNETVSFIAIEKGVYTLPRGTKIEVGSFEGSADYQSIALQQSYELTPVIFSQVMTESEADAVTGRIRNVSQGSYEYKLQEQESTSKSHQAEMVGYIAWEPGIGDLGNFQYEVGLTGKKVTHKGYTFTFQTNLSDVPLFLADMQTQTGGDTAVLRGLDISKRSARLKVEEEKSKDKEVRHSKENVGFLAIIGTTQPSQ
jgi:PKD repeat protein